MNFPDFFADAESNFNDSDFVIFGVPYDRTSSFRKGADQAPKLIRQSSWNFETYNIHNKVDFCNIKVHDYGNINVTNDPPSLMIEKLKKITLKILEKNKIPIAIGGEHSITSGIIQAFPNDIAVLSLDAHIDYRQEYENEIFNHACTIKRISDFIDINNITVFGIRSGEKKEIEEAKKNNLYWIDSYTINEIGINNSLKIIQDRFKNKKIYLSLDIDVIDPAFAPGTSTPEPFGLTPFDILKCIETFSENIIGFDIVEVCPPYDNGETSLLAAKLIKSAIEEIWLHRK